MESKDVKQNSRLENLEDLKDDNELKYNKTQFGAFKKKL